MKSVRFTLLAGSSILPKVEPAILRPSWWAQSLTFTSCFARFLSDFVFFVHFFIMKYFDIAKNGTEERITYIYVPTPWIKEKPFLTQIKPSALSNPHVLSKGNLESLEFGGYYFHVCYRIFPTYVSIHKPFIVFFKF